jgi:SEFIR domain.
MRVASHVHPTVFISYSQESFEHCKWVEDLASRLTEDGVQVDFDKWRIATGGLISRFMERIPLNDFVLIICTPTYKEKYDKKIGFVSPEGDIIANEIYSGEDRRKFLPLLRLGPKDSAIPIWIKGAKYLNFTGDPYSEGSYNELINTLYGTLEAPPSVGTHGPRKEKMGPSRLNIMTLPVINNWRK